MRKTFFLFLLLIFSFQFIANGQIVQPQQDTISILKGGKITKTYTTSTANKIIQLATPQPDSDLVKIEKDSSSTNTNLVLIFTVLKISAPTIITINLKITNTSTDPPTETTESITINVEGLDPTKVKLDKTTVNLIQNSEAEEIFMSYEERIIDENRVVVTPSEKSIKTSYSNNGKIKIESGGVGKAVLSVVVDGVDINKPISITSEEGIKDIKFLNNKIEIKQKEQKDLKDIIQIIGTSDTDITDTYLSKLKYIPSNDKIKIDTATKKIQSTGEKGTSNLKVSFGSIKNDITITILQKEKELKIEVANPVLRPNQNVTLRAKLYDEKQELIETDFNVDWIVTSQTVGWEDKIAIEKNKNNNSIELNQLVDSFKGTLKVTAHVNGVPDVEQLVIVQEKYTVTNFAWLKVSVDSVDDKTERDDWGAELYRNYYVVKVTLENRITKADEIYFGEPILVYSQSLEFKVAFEYLDPADNRWKTARQDQFVTATNSIGLVIPSRKIDTKRCDIISQLDFILPYRPLDYDTALLTQDSRENKSMKFILLQSLYSLSSLTSFITSIAVPPAGNDIALGLDKLNNLLIPSYQKLFPDRREVHRNNLIKQLMLPLEEVAFGSQITKYLLFPKAQIRGLAILRTANESKPVPVRIVGISGSDACANVAVIKKN